MAKKKQKKGEPEPLELFAEPAAAETAVPAKKEARRESTDGFFGAATDQSRVKARIVTRFVDAWANVIIPHMYKKAKNPATWRVGYADLFAGPGLYDDGTPSTPLLVLKEILKDSVRAYRFQTLFNDLDARNVTSLRSEVASRAGSTLTNPPIFWNREVSDDVAADVMGIFEDTPTVFFIDPWGYRGLTHELIDAVVSGWGNDCIFFFNYKRINISLENPLFVERLDAIFGSRASSLRERLAAIDPHSSADDRARAREEIIMEELTLAIQGVAAQRRYTLQFKFTIDSSSRTSHYLVFVSKSYKGYSIMKEIMANESQRQVGVPTFSFEPGVMRDFPLLEGFGPAEVELPDYLLEDFAGQTLMVREIIAQHSPGTDFVVSNYKTALRRLEQSGRVTATPPQGLRPRNTMGDEVMITFPPRTAT